MASTRWVAMLFVSAASLAGALPALAASAVTRAFLDNLTPNIDFLDRSSRFALKNSQNARVKAFALSEAREQTLAANAFYDWTLANAGTPVVPMVQDASRTALNSKDLDRSVTGSTKVPASPASTSKPGQAIIDDRLPRGPEDLDSMEGLEGPAFDVEYKDKQRDALQQIEADFKDYAANGDDPALKSLAARELPKIVRRLTQIGNL